eukprot:sb/3472102/
MVLCCLLTPVLAFVGFALRNILIPSLTIVITLIQSVIRFSRLTPKINLFKVVLKILTTSTCERVALEVWSEHWPDRLEVCSDYQEPTETSKQPIKTRYLGHVTGNQPIRDQYFPYHVPGNHQHTFLPPSSSSPSCYSCLLPTNSSVPSHPIVLQWGERGGVVRYITGEKIFI